MTANIDSLSFEDRQFVEFLCEEVCFNYSELQSPLLADEDRADYQAALEQAQLALSCFE